MLHKACDPLVSIIIPSYNHEKYIIEAVNSVFAQSYQNIELIIIDDGSNDNSVNIINKLVDLNRNHKIKFIAQDNAGLSKTLNKGVRLSSGEYIGFLASDDVYLPNKIEENIAALKKTGNDVGAVYSDGYIIDSQGNYYSRFSTKYPIPISKNIYKELLVQNWIPALSVLYKKDCFLSVGWFDEDFTTEDYDFFIRFSKKYKILFLNTTLFCYRQHGNNTSSNTEAMARQREKLKKKHHDMMQASNFISAIQQMDIFAVLKLLSINNSDHLLRKITRKTQHYFNKL
ncbi:MAG: glycosyltransferase [Candidatus Electrothrix sp. AUS3]|nr:glycosyltransferase [Candidatus Electrothrix gigas]